MILITCCMYKSRTVLMLVTTFYHLTGSEQDQRQSHPCRQEGKGGAWNVGHLGIEIAFWQSNYSESISTASATTQLFVICCIPFSANQKSQFDLNLVSCFVSTCTKHSIANCILANPCIGSNNAHSPTRFQHSIQLSKNLGINILFWFVFMTTATQV